jgi:hypothetical protein
MALNKIREFYTEWFRVCPNITSTFRIVAIFKSYIKENNDLKTLVGTSMNFNCTKRRLCKCKGS